MTYHLQGKQSTKYCHGTILDTLARVLFISKYRVAVTLHEDTLLISSEHLGSGVSKSNLHVLEKEHVLKAIQQWGSDHSGQTDSQIKKLCYYKWKSSVSREQADTLPDAFINLIIDLAIENKHLDYDALRKSHPEAKLKDLMKPAVLHLLYFHSLVQDFKSICHLLKNQKNHLEQHVVRAILAKKWKIILCGEQNLEPEVRLCQYIVKYYRHHTKVRDIKLVFGTSEVTSDKIRIIMDLFEEAFKKRYNATLNIESLGIYDDPKDHTLPKFLHNFPQFVRQYECKCQEKQQIHQNLENRRKLVTN